MQFQCIALMIINLISMNCTTILIIRECNPNALHNFALISNAIPMTAQLFLLCATFNYTYHKLLNSNVLHSYT